MGLSVGASARAQNHLVWGDTETVTLTSPYKPPAGNLTFAIPGAKRRNPQYKEQLPTGGVYGAALMTWLLPAVAVTAAGAAGNDAPAQAFTITDAGGIVWIVQDAWLNTVKSTWRCPSLNLTLAYNLRDRLMIKRPTLATDTAAGRTYGTYTTIYTSIACRFQETDSTTVDERGKRLTVKRYTVPVGTRLYLTIEDQVIDQDGNVYEVKGWKDADRIDQLQQLECERRW
jgi:hypothetical protein